MNKLIMSILAGMLLLGCDKGGGGSASTGSAASGSPTTSLTGKQLDDAYKLADVNHYDKSVTAVTGKLGKPQKTEGDTLTWYAIQPKDGMMPESCRKLVLSKLKGNMLGDADNAACGLKTN